MAIFSTHTHTHTTKMASQKITCSFLQISREYVHCTHSTISMAMITKIEFSTSWKRNSECVFSMGIINFVNYWNLFSYFMLRMVSNLGGKTRMCFNSFTDLGLLKIFSSIQWKKNVVFPLVYLFFLHSFFILSNSPWDRVKSTILK